MKLWAIAVLLLCLPVGVVAQAGSVAEQYLFAQANAERAQRGLAQLRWDGALYRAAGAHADEMAKRASIAHQYPGEAELADRAKAAGAKFSMIAENVAEAPTAVRIHDAWMNSPGHRANLLDARVDAVAIRVVRRDGQLYAVQDFAKSVESLTLDQQELKVAGLVADAGPVEVLPTEDARRTCSMTSGFAGERQPLFLMRYTAGDLGRLPEQLRQKIADGKYRQAAVGACALGAKQAFTSYSVVVLLYP